MSSAAMCQVWRQEAVPGVKLVLLALADVADEEGACDVCLPMLAARSGLSVDSVRRVLMSAGKRGLVQFITSPGIDSAVSCRCRLNLAGQERRANQPAALTDTPVLPSLLGGIKGRCKTRGARWWFHIAAVSSSRRRLSSSHDGHSSLSQATLDPFSSLMNTPVAADVSAAWV